MPASEGGFGGPPRPSRLPAVLGVLAIVVIVGTVVAIILLNRSASDSTAGPTTSSAPPASTTTGTAPSSSGPAPTSGGPTTSLRPTTGAPGGGTTVDNAAARLTYRVPAGWAVEESAETKILDVEFSGYAVTTPYRCGGVDHARAFAVSAAVQNSRKQPLEPAKTANAFAGAFAAHFYPEGTITGAPDVRESVIDGKKAVTLTASIRTKPVEPACGASAAEISIVAVDLDNATADHPSGVALLVVVRDSAGGPADPAPVSGAAVAGIVSGVQVR